MRNEFPALQQRVNDFPFAYLDSAATTQKPHRVIAAMNAFYQTSNANVHRGIHTLAERASGQYEAAREAVARFIGAPNAQTVVWTRGTTDAINLVAASYLAPRIGPGKAVLTTLMEHHSNFVPWQQLCKRTGAELRVAPLTEDGRLDLAKFTELLTSDVELVAITHVSNVLGTINPLSQIVQAAHRVGARVLVDAAQSVAHLPINVQELDVDFLAFSGHKLYGPTGIGVLYAKPELLESMEPVQFGGDMVASVSVESASWDMPPGKFEAGTPPIAEVIGLGESVAFLTAVGMAAAEHHEARLMDFSLRLLQAVPGLRILGPTNPILRSGLVSFSLPSVHPHDLASLADERGVAIRAGFHCAEPLHRSLGMQGSARMSLGVYTTKQDIEQLVAVLHQVRDILNGR